MTGRRWWKYIARHPDASGIVRLNLLNKYKRFMAMIFRGAFSFYSDVYKTTFELDCHQEVPPKKVKPRLHVPV
jgi:hypothetical protein